MANNVQKPHDSVDLGIAFEGFTNAVTAISTSYKDLQSKIEELDFQLTQKNLEIQHNLEETQRLKSYLNCIIDSMYNCLIVVDKSGKITLFNKAAEKLTGYSVAKVIGKHYASLFCTHTSERFTPLYALKVGGDFYEGEKEISTIDGSTVPVKYAMTLLTDIHGQVLGAVEVFSDLTAERMLEEQMHKVKVVAALTEMAGVVAHQIRNPLSGIGGYAALLTDDLEKGDPKRVMAEQIGEGVHRLDEIVNNLLLLTRNEKPAMTRIDASNFIKTYAEKLIEDENVSAQTITVEYDIPEPDLHVDIDPVLMKRALDNICNNALQSMSEDGGILTFSVKKKVGKIQKLVQMIINDTGVGIPRHLQSRIFEPFFTTRERGTGLGLTISGNLLKVQQCDVSISSKEGDGTKVIISIPLPKESIT